VPISISRVTSRAPATGINSDTGLFIPIRASLSRSAPVPLLLNPAAERDAYLAHLHARRGASRDDLLLLNNDEPCTHKGRPTTANIKARGVASPRGSRDDLRYFIARRADGVPASNFPTGDGSSRFKMGVYAAVTFPQPPRVISRMADPRRKQVRHIYNDTQTNMRNNRAYGEQVPRSIYLSGGPVSLRMVGFNLEVAEGGGVGGDASSSSSSSVPSDIFASSSSFAAEPQPRSLGLMGPSSSTQSPSSPWRSVPGAEPSTPSSPETDQADGRVKSSVISFGGRPTSMLRVGK